MMKEEFEAIAGYEVSWDDYTRIIEPMYLAIPESCTKQDFVAMIDKKRFALRPVKAILKEMRKTAQGLKDTCTHYTDFDAKDKLNALIKEYIARKGWKDIATYGIHEEMKWSCFYPASVEIYFIRDYKTLESIDLKTN